MRHRGHYSLKTNIVMEETNTKGVNKVCYDKWKGHLRVFLYNQLCGACNIHKKVVPLDASPTSIQRNCAAGSILEKASLFNPLDTL